MKVLFFSICLFFVLEACVRESNSPLGSGSYSLRQEFLFRK